MSRNQGFSYYFCLMIEGSGFGFVPLTNGFGSATLLFSDLVMRYEPSNFIASRLTSKFVTFLIVKIIIYFNTCVLHEISSLTTCIYF
jgi:hypothetical protein